MHITFDPSLTPTVIILFGANFVVWSLHYYMQRLLRAGPRSAPAGPRASINPTGYRPTPAAPTLRH